MEFVFHQAVVLVTEQDQSCPTRKNRPPQRGATQHTATAVKMQSDCLVSSCINFNMNFYKINLSIFKWKQSE